MRRWKTPANYKTFDNPNRAPVFIGIQADTRGAVAVLGDSSQNPKVGNMYYQQKLGYITLGTLFRQIRRDENIQKSRC